MIISITKAVGESGRLAGKPHLWADSILATRSGANPDPIQIADATIAVWYDIATALESIIGRQGVAALYNRSVALTVRAYPWLGNSRAGDDHRVDLDALQSIIAQQRKEQAAAAARELLQSFYDVLVSLVGPSLSLQLLATVRGDSGAYRPGQR